MHIIKVFTLRLRFFRQKIKHGVGLEATGFSGRRPLLMETSSRDASMGSLSNCVMLVDIFTGIDGYWELGIKELLLFPLRHQPLQNLLTLLHLPEVVLLHLLQLLLIFEFL